MSVAWLAAGKRGLAHARTTWGPRVCFFCFWGDKEVGGRERQSPSRLRLPLSRLPTLWSKEKGGRDNFLELWRLEEAIFCSFFSSSFADDGEAQSGALSRGLWEKVPSRSCCTKTWRGLIKNSWLYVYFFQRLNELSYVFIDIGQALEKLLKKKKKYP